MRLDKIILLFILISWCGVSTFFAGLLSAKGDKNIKYMFISILFSLVAIGMASMN